METPFDVAFAFVLKWEGGLSSNPTDFAAKGMQLGVVHTAYGITQDNYTDWRLSKGELPAPVANIEQAEVASVYFDRYWHAAACDRLASIAPKLAFCVFNGAVQHGPETSIKLWQRTVQAEPDGLVGNATLAATESRMVKVGEPALCATYLDRERGLYESIVIRFPSQRTFLNGWKNRVNAVAKACNLRPVWV